MRAAWRLATSTISAKSTRTWLLVAAVALSAALIAAVASAMASLAASLELRIGATVGVSDIKITPARTEDTLPASALENATGWDGVARAVGRTSSSAAIIIDKPVLQPATPSEGSAYTVEVETFKSLALVFGIDPSQENEIRPIRLLAGRLPEAPNEVVIDALLAYRLGWRYQRDLAEGRSTSLVPTPSARDLTEPMPKPPERASAQEAQRFNERQGVRMGDTVRMVRLLKRPVEWRVVGVAAQPPLGGRPQAFVTLEGAAPLTGGPGRYTEIDLVLDDGVDAEAFAERRRAEVPTGALLKTTGKITSGLDQNVRSSQLGFVLVTVLAFLSAAFIIMTGMTTDVTQRQRELSIVRCVGASRGQVALAQVFTGLVVGIVGGGLGVPLGVGFAAALISSFPEQVPSGLVVSPSWLALAFAGAVAAGLAGAIWPAWRVASMPPLRGLTMRARPARARGLVATGLLGLTGLTTQLAIVTLIDDGQVVFWAYVTAGLPLMYAGYFLLGPPVTALVARALGGVVSRAFGLPNGLLSRSVLTTPYRHGFTAGALMGGLALMVSIWTNGGAVVRDWLDAITFPDAFVSGLALKPEHQDTLDALPFVENTCAITLHLVETDAFGVRALQQYKSSFIAFEPRRFFEMTDVNWVEGERDEAIERLEQGGAIIVAREFQIAQGLGVGDTFVCREDEKEHEFEIVGVVTSPGLEIVSKFFNIGQDFTEQSIHAVFGSRDDLRERFGKDAINLIQIDLAEDADDAQAVVAIRKELFDAGILDAGSGRKVKEDIRAFVMASFVVFSAVAMVAVIVACFGVANVVVAAIETRRFEFGVLRAVGASRGLLVRLLLGEAIMMGLAACVLGTCMGLQGSLAAQRIDRTLLGISIQLRPPVLAIAIGCTLVIVLSLLAAGPSVYRLTRRPTRELLAAPND